ncbi:uncharacterized protein LOC120355641 [Nilaparvata lugens]|uniref:uncharacterized protein LOC120349882 n=1 Tax=Nilaparvata lugens TaxID=108931 RepID=UPI00193CEAF7|nr:uncharacterized protein LOC120349882 [Nilaparvata lugens]XP_039300185.1 uncharacterized protein LOC120355641 [Nilaparvata lugens]
MAGEKVNLVNIKKWSDEGKLLIDKCMEWGILKRVIVCSACGRDECKMTLRKCNSETDGYKWYCNNYRSENKKKRKRCGYSVNLRRGTFFEKSKLPLWKIIGFIYLWTKNVAAKVIIDELGISNRTVVDWSSFCREVTFDFAVVRKKKIGGPGRKVQIDESKFGKRKYNRGRAVEGQWVFGGIDELSGEVFMVAVENRSSDTLIPIIKEYIKPGSTIVSDYWKAYDCLKEEGFEHLKVNHKMNFVDPLSGAHTNKIEASWGAAKATLPRFHRKKAFFPGYLSKYVFMKSCKLRKVDCFTEFCKEAGNLYDPAKPKDGETDDTDETDDLDLDDMN